MSRRYQQVIAMDHEDTMTLDAFLTALSRLETPFPVELQEQLNAIAQQFPDSISELHNFVNQHAPLKQQYMMALEAMPSEGERLKFAAPQTLEAASTLAVALTESTVSWDEVERQVGPYFKEMALDVIERSHPDYGRKITEEILSDLKQAWYEAMTGQTIPISQLWDNIK